MPVLNSFVMESRETRFPNQCTRSRSRRPEFKKLPDVPRNQHVNNWPEEDQGGMPDSSSARESVRFS